MKRGPYRSPPTVGVVVRKGRGNAGAAVLSAMQVRSIRTRNSEGTSMYRLAQEHGISAQAIAKVVRRQSHKNVE
jgi:hypothetical protein